MYASIATAAPAGAAGNESLVIGAESRANLLVFMIFVLIVLAGMLFDSARTCFHAYQCILTRSMCDPIESRMMALVAAISFVAIEVHKLSVVDMASDQCKTLSYVQDNLYCAAIFLAALCISQSWRRWAVLSSVGSLVVILTFILAYVGSVIAVAYLPPSAMYLERAMITPSRGAGTGFASSLCASQRHLAWVVMGVMLLLIFEMQIEHVLQAGAIRTDVCGMRGGSIVAYVASCVVLGFSIAKLNSLSTPVLLQPVYVAGVLMPILLLVALMLICQLGVESTIDFPACYASKDVMMEQRSRRGDSVMSHASSVTTFSTSQVHSTSAAAEAMRRLGFRSPRPQADPSRGGAVSDHGDDDDDAVQQ